MPKVRAQRIVIRMLSVLSTKKDENKHSYATYFFQIRQRVSSCELDLDDTE